MPPELISREEFKMYCDAQQGNSDKFLEYISSRFERIEGSLDRLGIKMDDIPNCVNDRVTWDAFDRYKSEHGTEHVGIVKSIGEVEEKVDGRPSGWYWAVVVFLAVAVSVCVTVMVPLLGKG